MRKPRDGEETKERVLAAAQTLFAKNGFAGTSLAMISQESGISEGLILHHYQSKKNLYRQVLENLTDHYAQELMLGKEWMAHPEEMFRQSLSTVFQFWKRDSAYERLSLWAYLEGQTEFSEKEAALTAGLVQAVGQLQAQGRVDQNIHPIVFLTAIIGSIHFWNRYRDSYQAALNLSETPEELDALFLDQFIVLIQKMFSTQ